MAGLFEPRFRLKTDGTGAAPVVVVDGDVDASHAKAFAAILDAARVEAEEVAVDMRKVTFADSAALRVLFTVSAHTKLSVTVRQSGPVHTLLRISGLDRIVTVDLVD